MSSFGSLNRLLFCMPLVMLAGCSNPFSSEPTGKLYERAGTDVISELAERRETFFKDKNSPERFCRAAGPDFAVTASEGVSLGLTLPVGGAKNVGEDAGQGALSLGGRDPEVLLAREMLYRACELTMNINADGPTSIKIYERFLQSIEKLAGSQGGTGTAGKSAGAPTEKAPTLPNVTINSGSSSSSSSSSTTTDDSSSSTTTDDSSSSSDSDSGFQ